MILFKQAHDLKKYLENLRKKDCTVGFVPTMGALHDGHVSLINICNQQTDISVCSIFINPTQFNNQKDFQKYPVTIAEDILKLEHANCKVLFLPSVEEMYPDGTTMHQNYDLGDVEFILEGKFRPGHFQGVSQVVHRLLDIVNPDKLYLGQKDFQQCIVLKKLIKVLKKSTSIVISDTKRELTGLAMSSRNVRLSDEEKINAAIIYQCLLYIKNNIGKVEIIDLIKTTEQTLLDGGFTNVDYVAIADVETLEIQNEYNPKTPLVALIAAFIGEVRLIDNMLLD